MSNEEKYVYATEVVLEASGASAASNAYIAADDTSLGSTNHLNYLLADFALNAAFSAAVAPGGYVGLYRQDFDIDAAGNDSPAPGTTYEFLLVGVFPIISGQSAAASYPCPDVPLSHLCKFSLKNVSGKSLTVGWTLKATPKTMGPAA